MIPLRRCPYPSGCTEASRRHLWEGMSWLRAGLHHSHYHYHITTSHHITSHHITSHHITSHHITSHHITSHHTTSHHITSWGLISRDRPRVLDSPSTTYLLTSWFTWHPWGDQKTGNLLVLSSLLLPLSLRLASSLLLCCRGITIERTKVMCFVIARTERKYPMMTPSLLPHFLLTPSQFSFISTLSIDTLNVPLAWLFLAAERSTTLQRKALWKPAIILVNKMDLPEVHANPVVLKEELKANHQEDRRMVPPIFLAIAKTWMDLESVARYLSAWQVCTPLPYLSFFPSLPPSLSLLLLILSPSHLLADSSSPLSSIFLILFFPLGSLYTWCIVMLVTFFGIDIRILWYSLLYQYILFWIYSLPTTCNLLPSFFIINDNSNSHHRLHLDTRSVAPQQQAS